MSRELYLKFLKITIPIFFIALLVCCILKVDEDIIVSMCGIFMFF